MPKIYELENIRLANENRQLRRELEQEREYAAEAWVWLDDALKALGIESVFDIPKGENDDR